jgi:hypothetical protein
LIKIDYSKTPIWLISMASAEDRFILGSSHLQEKYTVLGSSLLVSSQLKKISQQNINQQSINFQDSLLVYEIDMFDQKTTYFTILVLIEKIISHYNETEFKIVIDISTMPREVIWQILILLEDFKTDADYVYFPPEKYSIEWLTQEPKVPRLVLRRSGNTFYGRNTAIIATSGFDIDRTRRAIMFFEPEVVHLGVQSGPQFDSQRRNAERHRDELQGELSNLKLFEYDASAPDLGYSLLKKQVMKLSKKYNVLLTSLGPKLSAISMFQISIDYPDVGLFYVPCGEINKNYSTGINLSKLKTGSLKLSGRKKYNLPEIIL